MAETAATPVAEFARPGAGAARCRALLGRISRKRDGTAAAANTANRKRAVLNNLMQYAVEVGALPANPLKTVKWTRPRTLKTVGLGLLGLSWADGEGMTRLPPQPHDNLDHAAESILEPKVPAGGTSRVRSA